MPACLAGGRPTGGESKSSLETVSRSNTNNARQVTSVDRYFAQAGLTYTTSTSFGTQDTNFYRTTFNYDSRGRLYKTTTPSCLENYVTAQIGTAAEK